MDERIDAQQEEMPKVVEKKKGEISKGLKIFDYVLAAISILDGIYKIYLFSEGESGNKSLTFIILPFAIAIGLLQHQKSARVICIILLALSLLFPLILAGLLSRY